MCMDKNQLYKDLIEIESKIEEANCVISVIIDSCKENDYTAQDVALNIVSNMLRQTTDSISMLEYNYKLL